MVLEERMMNKNKFTTMVEDAVRYKNLSYMDAIIHLSEQNNMELEDIRKFISPVIKNKLEAEAMRLNFLPRGNELPFE